MQYGPTAYTALALRRAVKISQLSVNLVTGPYGYFIWPTIQSIV